MGLDSELIAIGPFGVLRDADRLDYNIEYYAGIDHEAEIICCIALADTTEQSHRLAELCGLHVWDLGNHRVRAVNPDFVFHYYGDGEEYGHTDEFIGDIAVDELYEVVKQLLEQGCELWFMPHG